jgi:SAM-dependent methyltransferase
MAKTTSWLSVFRRHPDLIIEALRLGPGARVADVGAGRGYFTFRFARALGASGLVFAVEPDRRKADFLTRQAADAFPTVHVIEPARDDPSLPGEVDIIFVSLAYHHLPDPPAYFRRAARYLRQGGRVVIVETRPIGWLTRIYRHATDPRTVTAEMIDAGYELVESRDFLRLQSFLVFRRAGDVAG